MTTLLYLASAIVMLFLFGMLVGKSIKKGME